MAVHQVLTDISQGAQVAIDKIDLLSPEVIQRLGELGLFEGTTLKVVVNRRRNTPLVVDQDGGQIIISRALAQQISVFEV